MRKTEIAALGLCLGLAGLTSAATAQSAANFPTRPVRFILAGVPLERERLDRRVAYGVRFFLDGALPR